MYWSQSGLLFWFECEMLPKVSGLKHLVTSWWLWLGVAGETSGVEASLEEVGHGLLEWTLGSCNQVPFSCFLSVDVM